MTYSFELNMLVMSYYEYSYISTLVHMSLDIHQYDKLTSHCRYQQDKVQVPADFLYANLRMLKLADCTMLNRDVNLLRTVIKLLRVEHADSVS